MIKDQKDDEETQNDKEEYLSLPLILMVLAALSLSACVAMLVTHYLFCILGIDLKCF